MATVYLARDLKHDRAVAVKVLRPELAQALGPDRFLREIRTTAQLAHPHILPLLDSGGTGAQGHGATGEFLYYVMPYVEGESLRDRLLREKQLPLEDALQLTREVAGALSYAHSHGVVHRDIKPENILLQSGHAVVADFGIARAIAAAGSARLTEAGLAVGTPAYMSPEQAAGSQDLDGRSDLYSLGCVLYEMLSGDPPFYASTPQAVLAKKLSEPLPRISVVREAVPADIEAALGKALARTPADRFATAEQFATALRAGDAQAHGRTDARRAPNLRWWRRRAVRFGAAAAVLVVIAGAPAVGRWLRPGGHPRTAIAVLPFDNLSAEGPHSYFAGALHDELITQLAKVTALSPRARTSVMSYAGTTKPMRVIGEELAVGSVVEASVQVEGNRLRVNVHLIDPATETPLWTEQYNRALDDAFAVQSEIAQRIVAAVGATLTRAEAVAVAAAPTANAEAYRLYLHGEEYRQRPGDERQNLESAQQFFERALALDPGFALAHAGLSLAHGLMYQYRYDPRPERAARQRAEAETALRLAPGLPQAHFAMGVAYNFARDLSFGDLRLALREFLLAAEGMPGSGEVWLFVGSAYAGLGDRGGFQSAYDRAIALDPRNVAVLLQLGVENWMMHRYQEAVAAFDRAVALAPDMDHAKYFKAMVYVQWHGQLDTLRAVLEHGPEDYAVTSAFRERVRLALWERRPDALLALLPEPQRVIFEAPDAYEPALLYAAWAHQLRGDSAAARRAFGGALGQLDSALRGLPEDWRLHASRGLALAGLGQRAEAQREADWLRRAEAREVVRAWLYRPAHALILAQLRLTDAALAEIEPLLAGPSLLSGPILRLDPRWDPIRHDPRFQALVRRYGG
jgi:serine/threonine-protein kinase